MQTWRVQTCRIIHHCSQKTCKIISHRSQREYCIKFDRSGANLNIFIFRSSFQMETKNIFIETSFEIRRMQMIFTETSFEIWRQAGSANRGQKTRQNINKIHFKFFPCGTNLKNSGMLDIHWNFIWNTTNTNDIHRNFIWNTKTGRQHQPRPIDESKYR